LKSIVQFPSAVTVALVASAACSAYAQTRSVSQPNIIFVLPDQWRAQAFGFAGDPNVQTPHLDSLARESVNFTNAVVSMPVCCPSRASLLTGRRPLTTGVFLNDVPLDPHAITLAKVLGAAGYDTGYIGKWHLNGGDRSVFIPRERRQGFDYWKALECSHRYNKSDYQTGDNPDKKRWKGYDAVAQTKDAIEYLRDHAHSNKPFFLFLAWGPPHTPYDAAPAKYRERYLNQQLTLRPNVPKEMSFITRPMLANYYAHCSALDDCFGMLRAALKENGLDENTLLIFSSDHGDLLGSQGRQYKQQPYDESIRVPLLMHWPAGFGVEPRKLDAIVTSEDIMPTILNLCGIPIPNTVEGYDYSSYIRGGENPSDGSALISCVTPFGEWPRKDGGKEYRGIRTPRYTYVRDLAGPWLLFDNEKDPYQQTNLVGQSECATVESDLAARLEKKLIRAHDRFLPGEFYLQQWAYKVDKNGSVPFRD
jgi:arylsulfatase A-like enzyme